jgi:putative oxidoreductase
MTKSKAPDSAMKSASSNFGRSLTVLHALFSCSAARWAPLPLRLIVGYGFAAHGFAKLLRGADNFTDLLHTMGLPFPHFLAWLTIVTEIVGGFCIALGVLVPLVSIPMAVVLLVAITPGSLALRLLVDKTSNNQPGRILANGGSKPISGVLLRSFLVVAGPSP